MMSDSSVLLTNRCQLPCGSLWFGRAYLYEDHIHITGWQIGGRYRRKVALDRIQEVEWRTVVDGTNLVLYLDDGETVRLQLFKNAGTWNMRLHDLLGQSFLAHHGMTSTENEEDSEP